MPALLVKGHTVKENLPFLHILVLSRLDVEDFTDVHRAIPLCQTVTLNTREVILLQSYADAQKHLGLMHLYTPAYAPELMARQLGCIFDTPQLGPSTRVSKNAPEFTGRQLGP